MIHSPKHRFYVPTLMAGVVHLPDDEARHAGGVLRLQVGDCVELFDGRGKFARATVVSVTKRKVSTRVDAVETSPTAEMELHLAFAIPKGKRLDWLLEKATELGATSLTPLLCERSVAGTDELSANKLQRWLSHCLSAAKQCGLNRLPELRQPITLGDLTASEPDAMLFGDLAGDTIPLASAVKAAGPSITILVGPEGGFTDAECQTLRTAGATPVRLGPTVLRIETAAVALLAGCLAAGDTP
jgi:16S rRNA (uracil1498-N3)-methyltransferase